MAISIIGNGRTNYGPRITRDGLILYLDAANTNSFVSTVEVLVVAGGGGSGGGGNTGYQGGAGGGGGVVYHPTFSLSGATTVTVGQGGAGGTQSGDSSVSGTNGGDSQFSTLIAKGGGGGGAQNTTGSSGGSGGGGGLYSGSGGSSNQSTFTGATVYGNAGGSAQSNYTGGGAAGGGGGAGSAGGNASGTGTGGSGGQGVPFGLSGATVYYGGGGAALGGSGANVGAAINGATTANTAGTNGLGAGAGGVYATSGKAGGSGVVIIRYRGKQKATGGTITTVGDFTVHTFTSSGTFTPLWMDLSGNSYDGTLYFGPTFSSANSGSLVFDGIDDYVGLSSPSSRWNWTPSGSGLNTMTIDIWVKTSDSSGRIISKPWNGNGEYNYRIEEGSQLFLQIGASSYSQGFSTYATGLWENITCVVTPTQAGTYRNGVLNTSFANHGITGNTPSYGNNGEMLCIMTLYPYGAPFNAPSFSVLGNCASLRIYNRALSAAEIATNYRAGRARFGLT